MHNRNPDTSIVRRSNVLINTSKEASNKASSRSTKLLERAGYISSFGSGLYGLTSLGQETRRRVESVIRERMFEYGVHEVSLPSLQYAEDWKQSGRWEKFENEMFTFKNRDEKEMCLAPTHEEGIVRMFNSAVRSHRDLPVSVFQIREKHRDDRARNGLIRAKEFVMKDAYSMHESRSSMEEGYSKMKETYEKIFSDFGLEVAVVDAEVGVMGGNQSLEFVAPSESGNDELLYCESCKFGVTDEYSEFSDLSKNQNCPQCPNENLSNTKGIEVGHIFALGTRYSSDMDFSFDDADENNKNVYMASYGIGVTRVIQALLEQNAGKNSLNWSMNNGRTLSPFDMCIITNEKADDSVVKEVRDKIHGLNLRTLEYDNRMNIGTKFAESDLIGIPLKIIVAREWHERGKIEVEHQNGKTEFVDIGELRDYMYEEWN